MQKFTTMTKDGDVYIFSNGENWELHYTTGNEFVVITEPAGVVMVHNYPSGNPSPSEEDYKITAKINDAGRLLGIPLLDHIIVGDDSYFSFKENKDKENE